MIGFIFGKSRFAPRTQYAAVLDSGKRVSVLGALPPSETQQGARICVKAHKRAFAYDYWRQDLEKCGCAPAS